MPPTPSTGPNGPSDQGMTMREMSTRSGVNEATLRMWELRHGFPMPQRRSSGHRRYSEADLARVRAVVRARESGLSLQAAIDLAHDQEEEQPASVYAALRARLPELEPQLLSKRAMLIISRAIEDECLARAERPLLFGCFQRERFYRASEARWRELARTAERAVVFADFRRLRRPRQAPLEVPLRAGQPLAREWAIVCESPGFAACLTGWERPREGAGERLFEGAWTVEAHAVRLAAQVCWRLGAAAAPGALDDLRERLYDAPVARENELRSAIQLSTRMVSYATA
ncbi:MAG: MerR family transcriptional regulator [Solirubrobacterales bacterium]|nr:MerR family transcriptional regulator [Solirubrobacterales bacterium]